MAKSKSSRRWLREHETDQYVQRARREGYRSRASYKLLELQEKNRLFRPGITVVDLGAAPGGWSQMAIDYVGERGRVIASDILPMDEIPGVQFIQGDFTEERVLDRLLDAIGDTAADLVISDMAPNISGVKAVDQPRVMYLAELAFQMACRVLKPGGGFVVKVFQGQGFDQLIGDLRKTFVSVAIRKPDASRSRSSEVYVVATGLKTDGWKDADIEAS